MCLPIAWFANYRKHRQLVTLLPFAEEGELGLQDIFGFERLLGEQHDSKLRAAHSLLDVVIPERADTDFAILPYVEQMMLLEDIEGAEQLRPPVRPFASVAIADEDP